MHEQQGGHHASHPKWKHVPSIGQSHTGSRNCDRSRNEGPRAVEVHRRSGHPISVVGPRKPRGGSRSFRKRQAPSLQDCLCFREGGRCSPSDPLPFFYPPSRKPNKRLATLRRGTRHDLASPPPSKLTAMIVGRPSRQPFSVIHAADSPLRSLTPRRSRLAHSQLR